jgi:hypothetical protein
MQAEEAREQLLLCHLRYELRMSAPSILSLQPTPGAQGVRRTEVDLQRANGSRILLHQGVVQAQAPCSRPCWAAQNIHPATVHARQAAIESMTARADWNTAFQQGRNSGVITFPLRFAVALIRLVRFGYQGSNLATRAVRAFGSRIGMPVGAGRFVLYCPVLYLRSVLAHLNTQ